MEMALQTSVVEPFHFGPAPAPASQDGGSSKSRWRLQLQLQLLPCSQHLLLKKKVLQISLINLPGLALFKERYECFALLFQYRYGTLFKETD